MRLWIALALAAVVCLLYLPSLVAYRYTADSQRTAFLSHPWRSWAFLYTAFTVPGDSQLKTSGAALRLAESILPHTQIDVDRVRLLFLPKGRPFAFTETIDGVRLGGTVHPPHRFVWEVEGYVRSLPDSKRITVMLLDYRSGAILWDARAQLSPRSSPTPESSPRPQSTPSTTAAP